MADSTNGKATGSADGQGRGPETHGALGCPVALCPICLAVSAVQPLRPEVVDHLLRAGSEFFLAIRAVLDARTNDVDPGPGGSSATRLEKIDIG
jgi:hypothetical protein